MSNSMRRRSWPEDFNRENGKWNLECFDCGRAFQGHKRRDQCRECAKPPTFGQFILNFIKGLFV